MEATREFPRRDRRPLSHRCGEPCKHNRVHPNELPGLQLVSPVKRLLRWRNLFWLLAFLLIGWALGRIQLDELLATLGRLTLAQLALLLLVNACLVVLLSSRWWAMLRSLRVSLGLVEVIAYRLAGFAVSYFTPGPHFGGEPLQVYLLGQRGVSVSDAAASVVLDKAFELLANFSFLAFGVIMLLRLRILGPAQQTWAVIVSAGLLLLPVVYLLAAWRGRRPMTWILQTLPRQALERPSIQRLRRVLLEAEEQVGYYCRQPTSLALALLLSLVIWVALLGEYWLMARLLGLDLDWRGAVAMLTAARLALLLPFPGGLGVVEMSQVLAYQAFGFSPVEGASIALLIRGRDLLIGGSGLLLAVKLSSRRSWGVPATSPDPGEEQGSS